MKTGTPLLQYFQTRLSPRMALVFLTMSYTSMLLLIVTLSFVPEYFDLTYIDMR